MVKDLSPTIIIHVKGATHPDVVALFVMEQDKLRKGS